MTTLRLIPLPDGDFYIVGPRAGHQVAVRLSAVTMWSEPSIDCTRFETQTGFGNLDVPLADVFALFERPADDAAEPTEDELKARARAAEKLWEDRLYRSAQ